eukprot:gene8530-18161_t
MERYIASAQNLIAQNFGESVRALLEMAGDRLNLASLKRVQQSGKEIQSHQQAATMALEVLKRDFGKLVVLVATGPTAESWRDLPSRCKDVSSAADMYTLSLETLHGKTKTHGALISEEIERVSKVKPAGASAAISSEGGGRGGGGSSSSDGRNGGPGGRRRRGGGGGGGVKAKGGSTLAGGQTVSTRKISSTEATLMVDFRGLITAQLQSISDLDKNAMAGVTVGLSRFWSDPAGASRSGRHPKLEAKFNGIGESLVTIAGKEISAIARSLGSGPGSVDIWIRTLIRFCSGIHSLCNVGYMLATKKLGKATVEGEKQAAIFREQTVMLDQTKAELQKETDAFNDRMAALKQKNAATQRKAAKEQAAIALELSRIKQENVRASKATETLKQSLGTKLKQAKQAVASKEKAAKQLQADLLNQLQAVRDAAAKKQAAAEKEQETLAATLTTAKAQQAAREREANEAKAKLKQEMQSIQEVALLREREVTMAAKKQATLGSEIDDLNATVTSQEQLIEQMKAEKEALEKELTDVKSSVHEEEDEDEDDDDDEDLDNAFGRFGMFTDDEGDTSGDDYDGDSDGRDDGTISGTADLLEEGGSEGGGGGGGSSGIDADWDTKRRARLDSFGGGKKSAKKRMKAGAIDASGSTERKMATKTSRRLKRMRKRAKRKERDDERRAKMPAGAETIREAWLSKATLAEKEPAGCKYIPLDRHDPKYDSIVKRIEAPIIERRGREEDGFRLKVTKVLKVENAQAQAKFFRRCAAMHDPDFEGVKTLFHGTPSENVDSICRTGFRMPEHAGLFGIALYSSNDPRKAEWHCRGGNVIFMCRVALGNYKIVSRTDKDLSAAGVLPTFDSVFAPDDTPGTGGCTEYMVYHVDQMIPFYQIHYDRVKIRHSLAVKIVREKTKKKIVRVVKGAGEIKALRRRLQQAQNDLLHKESRISRAKQLADQRGEHVEGCGPGVQRSIMETQSQREKGTKTPAAAAAAAAAVTPAVYC